jgi:hypothetical protein
VKFRLIKLFKVTVHTHSNVNMNTVLGLDDTNSIQETGTSHNNNTVDPEIITFSVVLLLITGVCIGYSIIAWYQKHFSIQCIPYYNTQANGQSDQIVSYTNDHANVVSIKFDKPPAYDSQIYIINRDGLDRLPTYADVKYC